MVGRADHVLIADRTVLTGEDKGDGLAVTDDLKSLDLAGDSWGDGDLDDVVALQLGGGGEGACGGLGSGQTLPAALVAEIPEGAVLFPVGFQLLLGCIAKGHAPPLKELGQILLDHPGGGEGHLVVVGLGPGGVGVRLPVLEELVVEPHGAVGVILFPVVGQVELPVHAQLDKHVVGLAGLALGGFGEDGGVLAALLQAGGEGVVLSVEGLNHDGVDVVGDLRPAQLIHVVADLVGDAPAEEAVCGGPGGQFGDGQAADHAGTGAVADADMAARGVHKGAGEHLHTPDILAGGHVVLVIGVVDSLGGLADVHDVLPGQHVLVQIFNPAAAVGAVGPQHGGGGEGQQHGGGGDLRHVQALDGGVGAGDVLGGHIGGELVHIGSDPGPAGALIQAVPVGQLQHGDVHRTADVELNGFGVGAAVGQVQAAAPLGGLAADCGHGENVPAVGQRADLGPPGGGLGVKLAGIEGDMLPLGDSGGVDGDLLARPGGRAQGLQVAAPLAVFGAVCAAAPGLDASQHHAAGNLGIQQLLGQVQLVGQGLGVQVVVDLVAVQPGLEGVDIRLGYAGGQLGAQLVGEERGDVVGQTAGRIILHKQQLGETDDGVVLLLRRHADFYHIFYRIEGQNGKFAGGDVAKVGDVGPGKDIGVIACASVVHSPSEQMSCAV